MRTAEPGVYAIGDVVPTPMLAHVGSSEGILAVGAHRREGPSAHQLRTGSPSATYCYPEVASVGLTEKKARERGYDVKTGVFPFSAITKASISNEGVGMVKMVSDKKYDEVLGVHLVGPHATELLAEACVALRLETTTEELARTMHAHPTLFGDREGGRGGDPRPPDSHLRASRGVKELQLPGFSGEPLAPAGGRAPPGEQSCSREQEVAPLKNARPLPALKGAGRPVPPGPAGPARPPGRARGGRC